MAAISLRSTGLINHFDIKLFLHIPYHSPSSTIFMWERVTICKSIVGYQWTNKSYRIFLEEIFQSNEIQDGEATWWKFKKRKKKRSALQRPRKWWPKLKETLTSKKLQVFYWIIGKILRKLFRKAFRLRSVPMWWKVVEIIMISKS